MDYTSQAETVVTSDIMTPAVIIDTHTVQKNIDKLQGHCDQHGISLRPHIKTHKLPSMAQRQIKAGAIGITCQKIGEAETMADAGIKDILITYNIIGDEKLHRLAKLAQRCTLSVVADNAYVVDGLAKTFVRADHPLEVLIECDTGANRCGVQSAEEALGLARLIHNASGLTLGGLMTYPPMGDQVRVNNWLKQAKDLLIANGLPCPKISSGGTPNMWRSQEVSVATEHRSGTYIYNDRSLIQAGLCRIEDCALSVRATVISRPTDDRAIIDAGSKMLTSDLLGMEGFGLIKEAPDVKITSLSEEHGILDLSNSKWSPKVGDQIHIIPNHACVVSNMVNHVYLVNDNHIEKTVVSARGLVT
ncbi:alanine racemase [Kiloniella spongiae]|uniref:Alanine racemase n=1 Tax=Kiloniella spongiae TaxID=1489064 RepID=A0A0H2MI03_9PROT|nr:D-TA family PLP-dependent enzyme [Kiloniella spongiae]KLN60387.1 alanine racemase [Kiloniella spongiae]